MFESLKRVLDTLFLGRGTSIKRETVLNYIEFTFKSINNEVLPAFDAVLASKDLKAINKNVFLTNMYKSCGIIAKDNYAALEKIRKLFLEFNKEQSNIKKLAHQHLEDVITNKNTSAINVAIVGLVKDLGFMTSYVLDLLYFVMINEKSSDLPKIKFKSVKENLASFIEIYKIYNKDFSQVVKDIGKISNENMADKNDNAVAILAIAKTGKNVVLPTVRGFLGNPIYHFRMYLVDGDIAKYESLKIKKKLIELKVMELRLEAENSSDEKLEKQLKYYEDKLANLEYTITKYEQYPY